MAIAQNICFKYQKQGIVDVLLELNKALTGQRCRAGTRQTVHLDCPHGCCRGGRSGRPFAGSGIHTGNVKKI